MSRERAELLTSLLRRVSRSFYLTLKILPAAVREQIGLAYLLARATDTIADTELLPLNARLDALAALSSRIQGERDGEADLSGLIGPQGDPSERELLERVGEALEWLDGCAEDDRELIRDVLRTIVGGQELDLRRFAGASAQRIVALRNDAELDDYTYRVAGCVGEFWTRICRARVFPDARLDMERLLADGVRFGKGLQLVNILRDVPADLRQGRCYLPLESLRERDLEPADLLDCAAEERARPLYEAWLDRAQNHLTAGWAYTNALPWPQCRVRLACAWPILIGADTLDRLRHVSFLDSSEKVKVSRRRVKGIVLGSSLLYALPFLWRRLYSPRSSRIKRKRL